MQDWIVARQLYGTPGIAEVNSFGGELKQYEVAVDPNRLKAMNITIPEIFTALEKIIRIRVVLILTKNRTRTSFVALDWLRRWRM
nr:efflux RND transporter permease subunit [Sphingobacterium sp. E70]